MPAVPFHGYVAIVPEGCAPEEGIALDCPQCPQCGKPQELYTVRVFVTSDEAAKAYPAARIVAATVTPGRVAL